MFFRHILPASLLILTALAASGARPAKKADIRDLKHSIEDSAIIYPETFEADTQKLLEGWYMKNYTGTDRRYEQLGDVETSDAEIKKRLAALPTVIELPFNPIVRNYIDRYTRRGRAQVAGLLGLSNYYMPIFEQALEAEKLPLELKYLPVIESGLDPNAVSRHGATGLWQFMLIAANGLGLEVNSLVDERRDPYVSSAAAARLLKSLYETYGDWSLVIAAYNCGPGSVNKAIRRAGGEPKSHDFWSIYEYLSPETRGYYPMFIAANYVMNYYDRHNISPVLPTKPLVTDTVGISSRVHFDQISAILDIPVEELRILNPQYRADIIPGSPEKVYMLTLPGQQIHSYILSEPEILAYNAEKYSRRDAVEPGGEPTAGTADTAEEETDGFEAPEEVLLTAAHPESVVEIEDPMAELQGAVPAAADPAGASDPTAAADAVAARSRKSGRPASTEPQKTSSRKTAANAKTNTNKKKTEAKPANHTVKSGENLTVIAKQHGISVDELKKANNLSGDKLKPGETLKLPSKAPAKRATKSSGKKSSSKQTSAKKKRRR